MTAKTLKLLYMLQWTCDMILFPTMRKAGESFESWAHRKGLLVELERLRQQESIEIHEETPSHRIYKLTEAGRIEALGGIDPQTRWSRPWDGQWRLVSFDLPQRMSATRDKFRRHLRRQGFGYLQRSGWITPDPLTRERKLLDGTRVDVKSLFLFEGRPVGGESDQEIVSGAWDFARINRGYETYLAVLKRGPKGGLRQPESAKRLQEWCREERLAWRTGLSIDPLLPDPLLPEDYLGKQAWAKRIKVLRKMTAGMGHFAP